MTSADRPPSTAPGGMLSWPSYVLGELHRDTREIVERGLHEVGLGLREYSTLAHIDELDAASQQDVADRGRIDRSDLVRVLDRLQERRLITRERDPADRRRHVLALTASGRDALAAGTAASREATAIAFSALTEDELRTLHRLARKALGR